MSPVPAIDLTLAAERAGTFAALHQRGSPLLMANAWDPGSAKILAHLGYSALATTSAGFANSLGRHDGQVTREEAIAHGADLAAATPLPVSADLEHGFATDPDGVAETVAAAASSGLAGCSIEDWDPDGEAIYDHQLAIDRVAAAAEAAHRGPVRLVLTARAENHFRARRRLRRHARPIAGVRRSRGRRRVRPRDLVRRADQADCRRRRVPVNVLVFPGVPPISELAELGVARVSVGSGFALVAHGALAAAARELLEQGTYRFWDGAGAARELRAAFD